MDLRALSTLVQGVHVGFLDTGMTAGFDVPKTAPSTVAGLSLDGVGAGKEEIIADAGTLRTKANLSCADAFYMNPPAIG